MTFREKLSIEHPEYIGAFIGLSIGFIAFIIRYVIWS